MTDFATLAPITQAALTHHVFVCTGTACSGNGSQAVLEALYEGLESRGLLYGKKRGSLQGAILVTTCGSMGFCSIGPAVLVYPQGVWYAGVQPTDVPELIESLLSGHEVSRLVARHLS